MSGCSEILLSAPISLGCPPPQALAPPRLYCYRAMLCSCSFYRCLRTRGSRPYLPADAGISIDTRSNPGALRIIVAAFFSAHPSAAKYVAGPDSKLPAITYGLLGSLNGVAVKSLATALPAIIAMIGAPSFAYLLRKTGAHGSKIAPH